MVDIAVDTAKEPDTCTAGNLYRLVALANYTNLNCFPFHVTVKNGLMSCGNGEKKKQEAKTLTSVVNYNKIGLNAI